MVTSWAGALRGWVGCGVLAFAGAMGVSQVAPTPTVAIAAPTAVSVPAVDISAPLNEARRLLASGDYAGADSALRTLLVQVPAAADGHFLLGFALLHEQKPAASLTEYTQGAKFREPKADEMNGVASDYLLLKDNASAEHWLAQAAKLAPERPLTWYLLGRTQYSESRWADAERSFAMCLKVDPHHLRAQYNLGLVYEMLQRPDAAIAAYRAAIALEDGAATKDVQPYLELGILLRKQGKFADAVPLLAVAAGGGSRNPLAHQELGLAYEQLGRYDESAGELKAAATLVPQIEAPHFFLGRVYQKSGHKDEAMREFAVAAKLSGSQMDAGVPNANVPE
jgi:tetratricopeptide (TPR) repeat protein